MKNVALLILATGLFAACIWFFAVSGELFAKKDYLAGILHVIAGLSLVRAGVELARLSVIGRQRGVP